MGSYHQSNNKFYAGFYGHLLSFVELTLTCNSIYLLCSIPRSEDKPFILIVTVHRKYTEYLEID